MRTVVVYESMYGNTHLVADAIGEGLHTSHEVQVVPVARATPNLIGSADLVVVGGPTHVHGMSREKTRHAATDAAHKPASGLTVDPDAEGEGIREWLGSLGSVRTRAAAFDTRVDAPAVITGRASKGISRQLHHHGFDEIAEPRSFLVSKDSHLEPGEQDAARRWGTQLAAALTSSAGPVASHDA